VELACQSVFVPPTSIPTTQEDRFEGIVSTTELVGSNNLEGVFEDIEAH
jgi:hypothetical protein